MQLQMFWQKMKLVAPEKSKNVDLKTPIENLSLLFSFGQKLEILCKENKVYGLSAVQFGFSWDFFVFSSDLINFDYVFNCSYSPLSVEKFDSIERCLSIGNSYYRLKRYNEISAKGKKIVFGGEKLKIEDFEEKLSGLSSVVFQHETDHQSGLFINESGIPINFLERYK